MQKRIRKGLLRPVGSQLMHMALHNGKAATNRATTWADRQIGRRRRLQSPHTALIGLGAAALALPVGVLVGRRIDRTRRQPSTLTP